MKASTWDLFMAASCTWQADRSFEKIASTQS